MNLLWYNPTLLQTKPWSLILLLITTSKLLLRYYYCCHYTGSRSTLVQGMTY